MDGLSVVRETEVDEGKWEGGRNQKTAERKPKSGSLAHFDGAVGAHTHLTRPSLTPSLLTLSDQCQNTVVYFTKSNNED